MHALSTASGRNRRAWHPAIDVRAAALFAPCEVRDDDKGPRGGDEVLRIVGLVGSLGDAPGTVFVLVGERQHLPKRCNH